MVHAPSYEIYDGERSSYPEVPDRIETIATVLRKYRQHTFVSPKQFDQKYIEAVHHKNYLRYLRKRSDVLKTDSNFFPSYFMTDTYAPMTSGTFSAAKEAADIVLTGASFLVQGEKLVYSLCRPPGHHADASSMGGYCYINNAAVAAQFLSQKGRAAILDIDYHHGNGTQHMFYDRSDILYVSLHADPSRKYPYISGFRDEIGIGEGKGYNKNYSLPLHTSGNIYRSTLKKGLKYIQKFIPDFLIVSAGFDTYMHDPIGGFKLEVSFYQKIGQDIASLSLPTLLIQEGGYCVKDLGKIAEQFVLGLEEKA